MEKNQIATFPQVEQLLFSYQSNSFFFPIIRYYSVIRFISRNQWIKSQSFRRFAVPKQSLEYRRRMKNNQAAITDQDWPHVGHANTSRLQVDPPCCYSWNGYEAPLASRAQPVVSSGRLFIGSMAGTRIARNAETSAPLWRYEKGLPIRNSAAVYYIGQDILWEGSLPQDSRITLFYQTTVGDPSDQRKPVTNAARIITPGVPDTLHSVRMVINGLKLFISVLRKQSSIPVNK